MIFDHISNKERYRHLPWLHDALTRMESITAQDFNPGQIVIEENVLLLNCNAYQSRPESECFFEAHQKYIDVHFLISGEELIGHTDSAWLEETQAYDAEGDAVLYKGRIESHLKLVPGWFAVFVPGEPHLVGLQVAETSVAVNKIVAKVIHHLAE